MKTLVLYPIDYDGSSWNFVEGVYSSREKLIEKQSDLKINWYPEPDENQNGAIADATCDNEYGHFNYLIFEVELDA